MKRPHPFADDLRGPRRTGYEVRYGGTNGEPRTVEALQEEIKEVRAWGERQQERANHNQNAEIEACKRVQENQKARDDALAMNGILERKLARAVKQGFDPEKKEPYAESVVNENGTAIFFRVLKSGPYEGKVAQHYNGGSLLHNGELDPGQYLENYVKAGVELEDRIPMVFWGSGNDVIAPSEQEAQWAKDDAANDAIRKELVEGTTPPLTIHVG
jgi:hypothetical protein